MSLKKLVRYMPLPADQQFEQDMMSQAASDAVWQQAASQAPSDPSPHGAWPLSMHLAHVSHAFYYQGIGVGLLSVLQVVVILGFWVGP